MNQQVSVVDASVDICNDRTYQFQKPNFECWQKIFDYLALRDIVTMSKTCARMRQICGYYLRENFPEVTCLFTSYLPEIFCGPPTTIKNNDLSEFMKKAMILGNPEQILNAITNGSLKTLVLRQVEMNDEQINRIKDILKFVEILDLRGCKIFDDFHEKCLDRCPKLKQLIFDQNYFKGDALSRFFQQSYTVLESLTYIHNTDIDPVNNGLWPFLKGNSNIKHLAIDMTQIWEYRKTLVNSKIHLDCLEVYPSFDWYVFSPTVTAAMFVNLLKSLRECEFYRELQFCIMYTEDEDKSQGLINELATLNDLKVMRINQDIDLSGLVHLTELCIWGNVINIESMAKNLNNLESIFFLYATIDDISPFFRHSKRLKTVKVCSFHGAGSVLWPGGPISDFALNLFALNEQRKLLGSKTRVTVCVQESIYLRTKMAKNNFIFDFVRITRGDSKSLGSFDRCCIK